MTGKVQPTLIIRLEKLYPQSGKFSAATQAKVKTKIANANGYGFGVIHPLFCSGNLNQPEKLSENFFVQEAIKRGDYEGFKSRVIEHLQSLSSPAFAFLPQNKRIELEKWLESLNLPQPIISIPTKETDPYPKLVGIPEEECHWRKTGSILTDLGLTSMELSGELAYSIEGDSGGCVHAASKALFLSLDKVNVVRDLTYPNTFTSHHSSK